MQVGYIYRIKHKVLNLYYYGSTEKTLGERWCKHMDDYKHKGGICLYKYFDLFNVEDFYIHFVDLVKFENKSELLEREQWFIDNFECVNDRNAWGYNLKRKKENKKKYRAENRDRIGEYQKQYRNENKDRLGENQKQYYEKNKEKISENRKQYHDENKEKISEYQKKYREKNKDRFNKISRKYYAENKEAISKKNKEKIICECGCSIRRSAISRHRKSNKHATLMATN